MVLIKQKANGHIITSTYKEGEEVIIITEEFDGCDGVETVGEIRYIDRDECVYNFNGNAYKKRLEEYKKKPKEVKALFGFGESQMNYCYNCDYCKKWGHSPEEEKEIKKAMDRQIKDDYGLY